MKALQIEEAVQMLNSTNVVYSRAGGGAGSILLVKTDNNNSIFLLRKSKKSYNGNPQYSQIYYLAIEKIIVK